MCLVTATDYADNNTTASLQATTSTVLPDPTVTVTEYSSTISGDIGEDVAGVTVTLNLKREIGTTYTTIATAATRTDDSGQWSATLSPRAGFVSGDQLSVQYAPPSTQPTRTVPAAATYGGSGSWTYFPSGSISSDGLTVTPSLSGSCSALSIIVDGASHATVSRPNFSCTYSPTPALSDRNLVQVAYETTATADDGSTSNLTTLSNAGLVGGSTSPPICDADLVSDQVTCNNLSPGTFAVSLNGGRRCR